MYSDFKKKLETYATKKGLQYQNLKERVESEMQLFRDGISLFQG